MASAWRYSGFGLRPHATGHTLRRRLFQAGGVDDGKIEIAKPALALAAVARYARPVIDQRQAAADQPVEQGRLAHIGPADDGEGEAHNRVIAGPSPDNPSKKSRKVPDDGAQAHAAGKVIL